MAKTNRLPDNVFCDKCKQTGTIEIAEDERNEVIRLYLLCKECGYEYDITFKDKQTETLIESNKELPIGSAQHQLTQSVIAANVKMNKEKYYEDEGCK